MVDLETLLGLDRNDPAQRLALELAEQDQQLIRRLVDERRKKGFRQEDVAELLGVAQSTVASFERSGNDPRLSTIRRYAQAIGALVTHSVRSFEADRVATRVASERGRLAPSHHRQGWIIDAVAELAEGGWSHGDDRSAAWVWHSGVHSERGAGV